MNQRWTALPPTNGRMAISNRLLGTTMRGWIFLGLAGILASCGGDKQDSSAADPEDLPLQPPDPADGFQFSFSTTVDAYSEAWVCSVYPAPYEELSPVQWIEYDVTPGLHHMTLATPSLVGSVLEPGIYDCQSLLEEQMGEDSNYTMFFGLGAGDPVGEMHLPDGVAANMPAGLDVIHEIHYVNATDQPVEVETYVNAYTIPLSEVETGIWGGQVRDETIHIPAGGQATEWSRCVMNEDVEVLFLASHTHELGTKFTIRTFDGENTGDIIFENDDWHDPKITQYDPPLVVPAGTGFEWTCDFTNPNEHDVNYGPTSEDEMCNMTMVHTPQSLSAWCDIVETSDGVIWKP